MNVLLEVSGLSKAHQGLRPLRIASLVVQPGDVISIGGLDAAAAETFVHLLTGAALPDEGDVTLFGQNTKTIADTEAWLKSLDGIGMITARGILVDAFSVLQNVAISLTLDVDPIDARILPQAGELAREAGIDPGSFDLPAVHAGADVKMRVHLARAIALGARMLIAEHPSAALPREAVAAFGADLVKVARGRGTALVAITADDALAKAIGGQRLELMPATGELKAPGFLRKLFG
jgi:predicted ABC-type transport system involved in lysophospholipase L1 biosynthesis ATPase subunit